MSLTEELKALGADTEEGLERVMGDGPLYETMLGMFLDTLRDNPIALEEFEEEDREALIRKVHLLKGTTGNLALTPLFTGYNNALQLLRSGSGSEARAELERILPVQEQFTDCIRRHITGA
ncbi:MAG: hypothetical protein NC432_11270 [Roseburia sp.]|nr:hypothetical protein [Roseburia sp.]MCM1096773.1 hypothetical protein [Ruminococcus flavefaciens]